MTFSANQILTAAELNDLDIDSLVVDTDVLVVDKTNDRVGIGTTSPDALLHLATSATTDTELLRLSGAWSAVDRYGYIVGETSTDGGVLAAIGLGTASNGSNNNDGGIEFRTTSAATTDISGTLTRMVIDQSGRVGIGTTSPDHVLQLSQISGGEQDLLRCVNNNGSEGFRVSASVVRSATIANTTTGSAANVFVSTSSNTLFRSTSSGKYKTDVETMQDSYADAILGLRPVWYRSLCEHDPDSWGYWGFIAEEVAEIDARLVTFGVPDDYEEQYDEDGEKIEPDVADLTEPEGVQYDRLVPHLVNLLARQRDQIADLEQRVAALEAT